jgi:NAD(P)-dependent dehydrogenase (short-subunit alcohol dehydrogenase family)
MARFFEQMLSKSQCSKHGVMGLFRNLSRLIYPRDGIRVNAVCPTLTDTEMTKDRIDEMRSLGRTVNEAGDVAKVVLEFAVSASRNGQAVYVEGGRSWEFEEGLWRTMPLWLGEEPTARLLADREIKGSTKS